MKILTFNKDSFLPPHFTDRTISIISIAFMLITVSLVFTTPSLLSGKTFLLGIDFKYLHMFRIDYLKESISNSKGIPGWYSREFLGSPFWSNIQNFPLMPTRFIFYMMDTAYAYSIVVLLSALLSALFTYLFSRKCGLRATASALAGWTFACSGFFAARINSGHLGMIECYFCLPLILWLVKGWSAENVGSKRSLLWLIAIFALTSLICLSAHPQLPFYAIVTVLLFISWTESGLKSLMLIGTIFSGILSSLWLWYPFIKLIFRSTRVLKLERPSNDVLFPYWRLLSFVLPWDRRWYSHVSPNKAYFSDAVCYIGIIPLMFLFLVLLFFIFKKRLPGRKGLFFIIMGSISLITAFPFVKPFYDFLPFTLFRSPSRQIYVTSFCIALGFGYCIDFISKTVICKKEKKWGILLIILLITIHLFDLGKHDKYFICEILNGKGVHKEELTKLLKNEIKDGRVAIDFSNSLDINRKYDDVGFFDSIVLASTYTSVLKMSGRSEHSNIEQLPSSSLPPEVLKNVCVRYLISPSNRKDLQFVATFGEKMNLYKVPDSFPRVSFVPDSSFQSDTYATAEYKRISSDIIEINTSSREKGYVKIIEAYDSGWHAKVDGKVALIEKLDGFMMKVQVNKGEHKVILKFKTPGALVGLMCSFVGLILFILILLYGKSKKLL